MALLQTLWGLIRRLLPSRVSESIRQRVQGARPTLHLGGVGSYGSIFTEVEGLAAVERRLAEIRDPDTNQPLIEFHRAEELYHGRGMAQAPSGSASMEAPTRSMALS